MTYDEKIDECVRDLCLRRYGHNSDELSPIWRDYLASEVEVVVARWVELEDEEKNCQKTFLPQPTGNKLLLID